MTASKVPSDVLKLVHGLESVKFVFCYLVLGLDRISRNILSAREIAF